MYSLKKEAQNPVAWNKPCQKPDANMTAHHQAMVGMMFVAAGYRRSQGAPGHHGASPSLWELAGCVRRNDGLQPIRKKHVHLPLLKDVWILGLDLVPFSQQLEYVQNKQKKISTDKITILWVLTPSHFKCASSGNATAYTAVTTADLGSFLWSYKVQPFQHIWCQKSRNSYIFLNPATRIFWSWKIKSF